jgi:hypothetical protein
VVSLAWHVVDPNGCRESRLNCIGAAYARADSILDGANERHVIHRLTVEVELWRRGAPDPLRTS